MEGLLLGTLSFLDQNYYSDIINNQPSNELDNYYSSNIETNINKIDRAQATMLNNNSDFFRQFDSLKFDNVGLPKTLGESDTKISGFDYNLQRDLNFKNGFSEFQNDNMHYGVVTKENFTHNNMVPFTNKRDLYNNFDNINLKYEKLSGNDSLWKNKKETETFFEPFRDLTNPNGMKVMTEELTNRYLPSTKNNFGNLPFETDVRVLPGIAGQNSAPYPVKRINPRNVDELRSETNQKVSYLNKPLETIKKGETRAPDYNITKYKLPTYQENNFSDFTPNSGPNTGMAHRSTVLYMDSQRGENDNYHAGPAIDSNRGNMVDPNAIHFSNCKKENYFNDNTHAINAVNTRPVFLNTKSYTLYENDRSSITQEVRASGANNNNAASYFIDRNSIAKPTLKENNVDKPVISNINSSFQNINLQLTDEAKNTMKETTIDKTYLSNLYSQFQNINLQLTDEAKNTMKETTIDKTYLSNLNSQFQNINLQLTDEAKNTMKETTIDKTYLSNLNSQFQNINLQLSDEAKNTMKETTIDKTYLSNLNSQFQNINLQLTDEAKNTIKETTIDKDYISNSTKNVKNMYSNLNNEAKLTIKQTTIDQKYLGNSTKNVKNTYTNLPDDAKTTVKQTTINKDYLGNTTNNVKDNYLTLMDEAKNTMKETTVDNDYLGNSTRNVNNTYINNNDDAKITIKETTLFATPVKNLMNQITDLYSKNDEIARPTIKETILHPSQTMISDQNQSNYTLDKNNKARVTIKETSLLENYTGNNQLYVKLPKTEQAERNMCIDERREITALSNRPANKKSDTIRGNIVKENVRFNQRKQLYGYISAPSKNLDYTVTPFDRVHTDKKTNINDTNEYRIDSIFIDTLKDNPLVNDIYHQKNIDFN